jgi:hypothetical protein
MDASASWLPIGDDFRGCSSLLPRPTEIRLPAVIRCHLVFKSHLATCPRHSPMQLQGTALTRLQHMTCTGSQRMCVLACRYMQNLISFKSLTFELRQFFLGLDQTRSRYHGDMMKALPAASSTLKLHKTTLAEQGQDVCWPFFEIDGS